MLVKLLLCLSLLGTAFSAMASGAVSDQAVADAAAAAGCDDAESGATAAAAAGKPAQAGTVGTDKSPIRRVGADADNASRPPRWHSFLPGMFR